MTDKIMRAIPPEKLPDAVARLYDSKIQSDAEHWAAERLILAMLAVFAEREPEPLALIDRVRSIALLNTSPGIELVQPQARQLVEQVLDAVAARFSR